MVLHADQIFVPEPWASAPQGLNVAWCLDDFTEANGATRFAPGSHERNRAPTAAEADEPSPVADCCSNGACRCLGLMLALPQIEMPSPRAEAPSEVVAAPVLSSLPPLRPERPLRPPSA